MKAFTDVQHAQMAKLRNIGKNKNVNLDLNVQLKNRHDLFQKFIFKPNTDLGKKSTNSIDSNQEELDSLNHNSLTKSASAFNSQYRVTNSNPNINNFINARQRIQQKISKNLDRKLSIPFNQY